MIGSTLCAEMRAKAIFTSAASDRRVPFVLAVDLRIAKLLAEVVGLDVEVDGSIVDDDLARLEDPGGKSLVSLAALSGSLSGDREDRGAGILGSVRRLGSQTPGQNQRKQCSGNKSWDGVKAVHDLSLFDK